MITVNPLRSGDNAALDELFGKMSAESRYLRFHAALPALTASMRAALLDVDGTRHMALVARDGLEVVGIARLFRNDQMPEQAEVAVDVADAWHRRGVGGLLLRALLERAEAVGVVEVRASVLRWNGPALALLRSALPNRKIRRDGPVIEFTGVLCACCDWEITMEDVVNELIS